MRRRSTPPAPCPYISLTAALAGVPSPPAPLPGGEDRRRLARPLLLGEANRAQRGRVRAYPGITRPPNYGVSARQRSMPSTFKARNSSKRRHVPYFGASAARTAATISGELSA